MKTEIKINWPKFFKDTGWMLMFFLLGMLSLGDDNVIAVMNFLFAGYCVGSAFRTVVVVEVTKK